MKVYLGREFLHFIKERLFCAVIDFMFVCIHYLVSWDLPVLLGGQLGVEVRGRGCWCPVDLIFNKELELIVQWTL